MKYSNNFLLIQLFTLLLLSFTVPASAADEPKGTIKGTVVTTKSEPAANVSVVLQGTSLGAVTDESGHFQFRAPAGKYTLIISHVAMKSQEIPVEVVNGKVTTVPQITVNIGISTLNEVNVVGNKTNKFATQRSYDVNKMPLNNLENPQVYSTVSSELIAEQNVTTVDGALKNAPGVQTMWEATGRGGDGGSYYNLRGFATQSLLRNGIAGNVTNTVDAVDVERIEVVKGPSATLYGNTMSSYGGLINRITKKPYDDFGGQVSYTLGSYGLNRVTVDVNSPLDSAKKVLFRLNTAGTYNGSYVNNGFSRTLAIDPSLTYKVNDRLTINFDAEIYTSKNTLPPFFFFGTTVAKLGTQFADQLPLIYRQSYNAGDLAQSSSNDNFYGQVDYKISDHWKSQTNISSTYSYSNGFGPYYYLLSRDTIGRYDQSTSHSSKYIFEAQENINGDFHIGKLRNRFVGGIDFTHINSKEMFLEGYLDNVAVQGGNYSGFNSAAMAAIYAIPASQNAWSTFPYFFKNNDYSAYASDILNITDKLLAEAALRVDYFDNKGSYNPSTNITSGAYHQTALSPKFGLVYQLLKDRLSLFGNFQNGFSNENGTDFNHNPFKPEEANQLEGGAKLDLFDGKLSGTVSYYDIKVKNSIIPDPDHANFSIQEGSQVSRGIEAEVIANPFTGFNIIAGFTHNKSFYTNADPTIEGRRPPTAGSPNNANLWVSYRLSQGVLKGLGLGVGGNYASNNAVLNSTTSGTFYLPEYYIFNANAFYDWNRFHFSFGVNNFTNREWWTGYSTLNPQMLRQFVGTVAFKF